MLVHAKGGQLKTSSKLPLSPRIVSAVLPSSHPPSQIASVVPVVLLLVVVDLLLPSSTSFCRRHPRRRPPAAVVALLPRRPCRWKLMMVVNNGRMML
ncbi:hypothetical protein QVD17_41601 [Tagetes erecta]|uniref:Uncharacterized protein n=1 Tax=Tagetes erecta TaxID=13708 RepID=A0AAD8NFR8_TARER|nr:hypothetical protein QVD17_41601 [Tagetes erecta]